MTTPLHQSLSKSSVAFLFTLSALVLIGWSYDIQLLKSIIPLYVSMKVNTAFAFLLTGINLCLLVSSKPNLARISSFLVVLFMMAILYQDVAHVNLGIDELFIKDTDQNTDATIFPGRPAISSSICFLLLNSGFIFITFKHPQIAQILFHIVSGLSFIAILGYAFNISSYYNLLILRTMAVHTAIGLMIGSLGASFLLPNNGFLRMLTCDKFGCMIARKLLGYIISVSILTGLINILIIRSGIAKSDVTITIYITEVILFSLLMVNYLSNTLNQIDEQRHHAEQEIIETNQHLEKIVVDRTYTLMQKNKQLQDFAYMVSHNLRGPVGSLGTLLNLFKDSESDDERAVVMGHLDRAVGSINETLNTLLDSVKTKEMAQHQKELVQFETIYTKIIQSFKGTILQQGANISTQFEVKEIMYNPLFLESILQNLISNSLKYASPERKLQISVTTLIRENKTQLMVTDNGLGIDLKKHGEKLFGLNKTFHRHPEAKGVGLFMTKAQVEAMGGTINALSEPDKGSTFVITFN